MRPQTTVSVSTNYTLPVHFPRYWRVTSDTEVIVLATQTSGTDSHFRDVKIVCDHLTLQT